MSLRQSVRFLGAGALIASGLAVGTAPAATAEPCPDVEIVFARGTAEAPGVGGTGQAFAYNFGRASSALFIMTVPFVAMSVPLGAAMAIARIRPGVDAARRRAQRPCRRRVGHAGRVAVGVPCARRALARRVRCDRRGDRLPVQRRRAG